MARWPLGKARLSSAAASSPGSVGARSWGQVGGCPGRLRALQGRDAETGNTGSIAGKALDQAMVRRGSTVRVRQRALQKRRTSALLRSGELAPTPTCGGYGAVYGAFASASRSPGRRERRERGMDVCPVSPRSQRERTAGLSSSVSRSPSVPLSLARPSAQRCGPGHEDGARCRAGSSPPDRGRA